MLFQSVAAYMRNVLIYRRRRGRGSGACILKKTEINREEYLVALHLAMELSSSLHSPVPCLSTPSPAKQRQKKVAI
jgi:hypothetical protein